MIFMAVADSLFAWDATQRICGDSPDDVRRKCGKFIADGKDKGEINSSRTSEITAEPDPADPETMLYCATVFYNRN